MNKMSVIIVAKSNGEFLEFEKCREGWKKLTVTSRRHGRKVSTRLDYYVHNDEGCLHLISKEAGSIWAPFSEQNDLVEKLNSDNIRTFFKAITDYTKYEYTDTEEVHVLVHFGGGSEKEVRERQERIDNTWNRNEDAQRGDYEKWNLFAISYFNHIPEELFPVKDNLVAIPSKEDLAKMVENLRKWYDGFDQEKMTLAIKAEALIVSNRTKPDDKSLNDEHKILKDEFKKLMGNADPVDRPSDSHTAELSRNVDNDCNMKSKLSELSKMAEAIYNSLPPAQPSEGSEGDAT